MQEPFHQLSEDFMSWLRAQPGVRISPKIELADFRSRQAGRGVRATQPLAAGEELFLIPHASVLSVHTSSLRTLTPSVLSQPTWAAAILTLLYEHGQGANSTWAPYLALLPDSYNTLLYWTPAELAELQASAAVRKAGHESIARLVDDLILPFVREHGERLPQLWGGNAQELAGPLESAREVLLRLVLRLGTLVMAYAFDVEKPEGAAGAEADEDGYVEESEDEEEGGKGMVPLADMLNADGDERNNARLEHEDDGVRMVATQAIAAGDECLNDYGPCPRSDLLRRYGYTSDAYAAHDVVELNLDQIQRVLAARSGLSAADFEAQRVEACVDGALPKKMARLLQRSPGCEDAEFLDDTYDIPATPLAPATGEEQVTTQQEGDSSFFDPGLLLTVQALTTDPREHTQLLALERAPTKPSSSVVAEALYAILEDRLREYGTTIAQDKELLKDESLPLRRRQAVEVRLGEKEILARAATTLRQGGEREGGHGEANGEEQRSAKRVKT